jgi:hypothetical protein
MTTMSNMLQVPGKGRTRKDSSTFGSIPTLMALDEEERDENNHLSTIDLAPTPTKTDLRKYSDSNLPSPTFSDIPATVNHQKKQKSSRRSSLGLGLLMGGGGGGGGKSDSNKSGKRRSSIAAILGRKNSKVCVFLE